MVGDDTIENNTNSNSNPGSGGREAPQIESAVLEGQGQYARLNITVSSDFDPESLAGLGIDPEKVIRQTVQGSPKVTLVIAAEHVPAALEANRQKFRESPEKLIKYMQDAIDAHAAESRVAEGAPRAERPEDYLTPEQIEKGYQDHIKQKLVEENPNRVGVEMQLPNTVILTLPDNFDTNLLSALGIDGNSVTVARDPDLNKNFISFTFSDLPEELRDLRERQQYGQLGIALNAAFNIQDAEYDVEGNLKVSLDRDCAPVVVESHLKSLGIDNPDSISRTVVDGKLVLTVPLDRIPNDIGQSVGTAFAQLYYAEQARTTAPEAPSPRAEPEAVPKIGIGERAALGSNIANALDLDTNQPGLVISSLIKVSNTGEVRIMPSSDMPLEYDDVKAKLAAVGINKLNARQGVDGQTYYVVKPGVIPDNLREMGSVPAVKVETPKASVDTDDVQAKSTATDVDTPSSQDRSQTRFMPAADVKSPIPRSPDIQTRMGMGASGVSIAFGLPTLIAAANGENPDAIRVGLAGGDIVVAGGELITDIARGASTSGGAGFIKGANILGGAGAVISVASGVYDVVTADGSFIEDDGSIGHKGDIAISTTATTAIGLSPFMASGGIAAGSGVIASATAVAAPLVIIGASTYAVSELGSTVIETRDTYRDIDRMIDKNSQATKISDSEVPSLGDYLQCRLVTQRYSDQLQDFEGYSYGEPGEALVQAYDIDFTIPGNVEKFETMLATELENQKKILNDNSSWVPDMFRSREEIGAELDAKANIAQLEAAQKEFDMFKEDLRKYEDAKQNLTVAEDENGADLSNKIDGIAIAQAGIDTHSWQPDLSGLTLYMYSPVNYTVDVGGIGNYESGTVNSQFNDIALTLPSDENQRTYEPGQRPDLAEMDIKVLETAINAPGAKI